MPVTRIEDVIVPELWVPYVIKRTMELSELVKSGIITQNELLNQKAASGGVVVSMPFWNDLGGIYFGFSTLFFYGA